MIIWFLYKLSVNSLFQPPTNTAASRVIIGKKKQIVFEDVCNIPAASLTHNSSASLFHTFLDVLLFTVMG